MAVRPAIMLIVIMTTVFCWFRSGHAKSVQSMIKRTLLQRTLATATATVLLTSLSIAPVNAHAQPSILGDSLLTSYTVGVGQSDQVQPRRLGLQRGRLQGCQANENCFSTSSTASGKYLPPWTYRDTISANNPELAWKSLLVALQDQGLKVLQDTRRSKPTENLYYLLAAEKDVPKQPPGASLFYEFLLRPDDELVLYRAIVDKTVFIYPMQQPVTDFGALQSRLDAVRNSLGWAKVESLL